MKHTISATSVAASTNGIANDATGAAFTLTAASAGDSLAHLITVTGGQVADHSAKTAVITGTDHNGAALTETINLPNGTATVTSTKYFLTVSSVTPSATIGTDLEDIGWALGSVSPSVYPNLKVGTDFALGFGCTVATGSPTYTVQHSYDGTAWFDHATVAAKTVSFDGGYTTPVASVRLKFTAAGGVSLTGYQAGA